MTWEPEALQAAAAACGGYPFMIQLVGYWAYRAAQGGTSLGEEATAQGIQRARRKLGQLVHEPELAELSDVDRTFLLHMAQYDGPVSVAAIGEKLGKSRQYTNAYRRRLLDAQIIEQAGHGLVDFALPYMRDYLREHAASWVSVDL